MIDDYKAQSSQLSVILFLFSEFIDVTLNERVLAS